MTSTQEHIAHQQRINAKPNKVQDMAVRARLLWGIPFIGCNLRKWYIEVEFERLRLI